MPAAFPSDPDHGGVDPDHGGVDPDHGGVDPDHAGVGAPEGNAAPTAGPARPFDHANLQATLAEVLRAASAGPTDEIEGAGSPATQAQEGPSDDGQPDPLEDPTPASHPPVRATDPRGATAEPASRLRSVPAAGSTPALGPAAVPPAPPAAPSSLPNPFAARPRPDAVTVNPGSMLSGVVRPASGVSSLLPPATSLEVPGSAPRLRLETPTELTVVRPPAAPDPSPEGASGPHGPAGGVPAVDDRGKVADAMVVDFDPAGDQVTAEEPTTEPIPPWRPEDDDILPARSARRRRLRLRR